MVQLSKTWGRVGPPCVLLSSGKIVFNKAQPLSNEADENALAGPPCVLLSSEETVRNKAKPLSNENGKSRSSFFFTVATN